MSERLPYEQHLHQQWTEVPLPDEDMAWADMKRRLEEDDDDGFIFWWRPGCGIIALLLVLLGLGWWVLRDKEDKENKEIKQLVQKDSAAKKRMSIDTALLNKNIAGKKRVGDSSDTTVLLADSEKIKKTADNESIAASPRTEKRAVKVNREKVNPPIIRKDKIPKQKNVGDRPAKPAENDTDFNTLNNHQQSTHDTTAIITPTMDSVVLPAKKTEPVKKKAPDSPSVKKPNQPDSAKSRAFFFSTGLSIQQQLPIGGQKATPYNSLGRKGSLLDYIPSVYVRLNRKDKWFLQAEFKYGAPQYTKEFLYYQQVLPDTVGGPPRFLTTTSNSLKKSFYHQLPFSFNYFVKPNWSVGAGAQWNKFYGAVSDQEIVKHDVVNNTDQVLAKGIVVTTSDSSGSFEKSYFQAVLESQYRWKRFSFGARFTFGLTPYVRITLPNQPERKEKNSNVLIFVRYELWRQKR